MHLPAPSRPVPFLIALVCAATFLWSGDRAPDAVQTAAAPSQGSRPAVSGRALLVGVTEYPRLRQELGEEKYRQERIELKGPENDVRLVREVLVDVLKIQAITELVGWDPEKEAGRPTRAHILAALDRLITEARPGELVVVYLAGHGSQQPDRPPLDDKDPLRFDAEPDGCDELFLPADTAGWRSTRARVENAIVDDELTPRIAAIAAKGARVWLLVDACHSGTMVRGLSDSVVERQILPETLGVPPSTLPVGAPAAAGSDLELPAHGVVAMYASAPHESAIEKPMDPADPERRYHGVFTWLLAKTLRRCGAGITFDELQRSLAIAYAAEGIHSVSPTAQGDLSSRLVDGADVGPQLVVTEKDGTIELSAGLLHDLQRGARVAVFEPGRRGNAQALLGHVEVDKVELARSWCIRPREGPRLPTLTGDRLTCPAEIVSCPIERRRIQLAIVDEKERGLAPDALPAELRRVVADPDSGLRQVELTDKPKATWLMQTAAGGLRLWKGTAGRTSAHSVTVADLRQRLENAYRVENLCRIASHPSVHGLPRGLRAELQTRSAGVWRSVQAGEKLRPGTEVQFVVQNGTGTSLDLWAFYLGADDSTELLYPNANHGQSLGRDEKQEIVSFKGSLTDTTLGVENILVLALPHNSPNLAWVAGGGRTRGQGDGGPIADVMELLSSGTTRGITSESLAGADGFAAQLQTLHVTWGPAAARTEDVPATPPRVTGLDGIRRPMRHEPEPWQPVSNPERSRGDLSAVYGKRAPAVFAVRTRTGYGTGFLVDRSGHVLTNHHVVANGASYASSGQHAVQLIRGTLDREGMMRVEQAEVQATIVWIDPERDLALLRIVGTPAWLAGLEPIPLRESAPKPGEECLIVGHPSSGMLWTLRAGRIGSIGRGPHDMVEEVMQLRQGVMPDGERAKLKEDLGRQRGVEILLSDCAANPGDSGGPLLDGTGQLIGVTFAIPKEIRDDKFTYHVHPKEVKAFIAEASEREAREPAGKVHVPLPSDLGPTVRIRQSGVTDKEHDGKAWDVVIATDGERTWVFIDADGDSTFKPSDPNDRAAIVAALQAGTFDADLALYFSPAERRACYDRDNDGKFDLVLVDIDPDQEADVMFSLKDGTWRVELDVSEELIRMEYLEGADSKTRIRAAKILRQMLKE